MDYKENLISGGWTPEEAEQAEKEYREYRQLPRHSCRGLVKAA